MNINEHLMIRMNYEIMILKKRAQAFFKLL